MKTLVHAFVMSRVDYCNAILAGSPRYVHYWQATTLAECCSTSHHRYTKVRPRPVILVALRVALAWHPRMRPLQAGSNSAPMSARQGPQVPGRLLHTSLRHCQQTTSAICQSTSPDSTTSPAQYLWSSGLLCHRSDGLEFIGGAIGGARGAMAPPIIWLGGGHTVFAPPNILHWNLKF